MAYELTFYEVLPGRSYSETNSPVTSGATRVDIGNNSAITIHLADDDPHLHQVGADPTPATLAEDLVIGSTVFAAGTEVALSRPTRFTTQVNGERVTLKMQGLLIKEDGVWKPILPATASRPGIYIFTRDVPETDPEHGQPFNMPPGSYGVSSLASNNGTVHVRYQGEPDIPPVECFALGTLIDTPDGPRRVETLRPGDPVLTRDHGAQALIWTGRAELRGAILVDAPNLRPVRIAAGALGPGCPARDLVVSPQHRMLLDSRIIARLGAADEVLVPACQLIGWPGIEALPAETGVTYLHLLLDRHEVLRAEGAWTESLYLGPELRKRRTPMAREIAALFPELLSETHPLPEPARIFMRGRRLRELLRRAQKNGRDLVEGKGADHKGGRTSRAVPAELV